MELQERIDLWLHGAVHLGPDNDSETIQEEWFAEMKVRDCSKLTVNLLDSTEVAEFFPCESYSSVRKVLRVTAYAIRFIQLMRWS